MSPSSTSTAHPRLVQVFTTARDTDQRLTLTQTSALGGSSSPTEAGISVFVNVRRRFQEILGIGGAITDASAEVFARLPPDQQQEFLEAYYDPERGIGYTLARTSIHSSDFSSRSHTYIHEGDEDLSTFDIEPDRRDRIPMIKRAIEAAGGELRMYASPWSPPAFMKDNGSMLQGGKLLPEYRVAWARYYAKFIRAYEAEGVPIWGVTVQNEPAAVQRWESHILTAEEERDFLRDHLGPTLASEGLGDKKIVVWDHNRDLIGHRAHVIFSDPEAAGYAWGIGFHWYETWRGGEPMHRNLLDVAQSFPDKKLLLTEACVEGYDPSRLQHWPNAERYGRSLIHDFNAGTVGWTDWNILLDEGGGPNHVGNYCFAPIHADTQTGALIYTPSYAYLGHFSKFVKPGARRISTTTSFSDLLATAFVDPDGAVAVVVMNPSDQPLDYDLDVEGPRVAVHIPAHAIQTLVL